MRSKRRVVFAVGASPTEARSLMPILLRLRERPDCALECLLTLHMRRDDRLAMTKVLLEKEGVRYRIPGIDAPLNAESLIRECKPDVVVLANDCLIVNRFLIREAGARGVPTVLVQEGPASYEPVVLSKRSVGWIARNLETAVFLVRVYLANGAGGELGRAALRTIWREPIGNMGYGFGPVSHFCVLSDFDVAAYRRLGSRAIAISATGIPGVGDPGSPGARFGAPKFDVVLFSSAEDQHLMTTEQQIKVYRDVIETVLLLNPSAAIGLKPHPLEDRRKFQVLEGVELLADLEDALASARVVVGTMTTVLLQTLLRGLPTVMYQPAWVRWPDSFIRDACRQLGVLAATRAQLVELLQRADRGLEREPTLVSFRQEWNARLRGSVGAIGDLIMEASDSREQHAS